MQGFRSALMLLVLAPMCVAWTGSGSGEMDWSAGDGVHALSFDLMGTKEGELHTMATLGLPDGRDAVLSVYVEPNGIDVGELDLPSPQMAMRYTEYNADGSLHFEARRDPKGSAFVRSMDDGYGGRAAVSLVDVNDATERRSLRISWALTQIAAEEPSPVPEYGGPVYRGPVGSPPVADSGGCSDGWDDDDEGWVADDSDDNWESSDSGGCDGDDDWDSDSDDDWESSDSGGCDGDDEDWSSDSDDSGGCDGDDVSSSSSSDSEMGCEGDAIAAGPNGRRRRSPWIMRLVNWMPWLMVFGFVRLARRRRGLYV
jgi:hypothetical protein